MALDNNEIKSATEFWLDESKEYRTEKFKNNSILYSSIGATMTLASMFLGDMTLQDYNPQMTDYVLGTATGAMLGFTASCASNVIDIARIKGLTSKIYKSDDEDEKQKLRSKFDRLTGYNLLD